jgi:hypothetical protein
MGLGIKFYGVQKWSWWFKNQFTVLKNASFSYFKFSHAVWINVHSFFLKLLMLFYIWALCFLILVKFSNFFTTLWTFFRLWTNILNHMFFMQPFFRKMFAMLKVFTIIIFSCLEKVHSFKFPLFKACSPSSKNFSWV